MVRNEKISLSNDNPLNDKFAILLHAWAKQLHLNINRLYNSAQMFETNLIE